VVCGGHRRGLESRRLANARRGTIPELGSVTLHDREGGWDFREAQLGPDAPEVTHLIRDRDSIFGDVFQRKVNALGIADVVTPKASPWCNGFAERVIGTLRRECTDHIIPLGERHLGRVLREFVAYYNSGRCHQGLDGDAPVSRRRWRVEDGDVQATPVLGGLHHVYSRAA
jgi:transposase InsO family protein